MTGKTVHLDRAFVRLYTFSAAWALIGAAVPALVRGILWLGILLLIYAIGMVVLGLHPRSARDHDQPARFIATYPMVVACLLLATGFIGWLTGAIRNTLWLFYFASLLVLYAITIAAFVRSIRRPPPSSQDPGTQSSQGLGPRSPTGQGIAGRPKSR